MKHPLTSVLERYLALDVGRMFLYVFSKIDVQFEVSTLNTERQLAFGKRADGSELPDYSEGSAEVFGKAPGPIILYDTGAFWRSFEAKAVSESAYLWTADGQKEDKNLFEEYGFDIIGLSKESIIELLPLIREYSLEYIRNELKV